jgi:hypothetical protein
MIEYKLFDKNSRPIKLDDIRGINKSINDIFPENDTHKMSSTIRKTYGINGEAFHVYYGDRGTSIILPSRYEESIKEKLEFIAELKLEKTKCQ